MLKGRSFMAETYCGKNCAECSYRAGLGCPGCQDGPGKAVSGDCRLANCCREKGHAGCGTCGLRSSCGKYLERKEFPRYRQEKRAAEEARRVEIAENAPFFCKWVGLLFWLSVFSEVVGLVTDERFAEWVPGLYWTGTILGLLGSAGYIAVLLFLSAKNSRYRTAAVCLAVVLLVNGIVVFSGIGYAGWSLILTLPAAVVSLAGEYQEFQGYAEILLHADGSLSEKWRKLWKWDIGSFLASIVCAFLVLLSPLLGAAAFLVSMLALLVVGIAKMVYLWRTARVFRAYRL